MSLCHMRKFLFAIAVVAIATPAVARAQLGLSGGTGRGDYRRRAEQFMTNRGLGETYRSRIRSNSVLFGRSSSYMRSTHTMPLIMSEQYGLISDREIGPRDRAGRWLRGYRLFDIRSQIASSSVDLPQATDYHGESFLGWTTDEVLSAQRRNRPTAALALAEPARSLGAAERMATKLDDRADESFRACAEKFRNALDTDDRLKRNQLIAEARNEAGIVMQLDYDSPRGYLADAIIAYQTGDFNKSLVVLELGIRRGDTLASLDIDREAFFGDNRAWEEMVDQANIAARSSDNARILLLQAYLSFLSGNLDSARSAADRAVQTLETQLRNATEEEEAADEIAGISRQASVDRAKHFRDLLAERIANPKGAGSGS